jgi:hypothetical protein
MKVTTGAAFLWLTCGKIAAIKYRDVRRTRTFDVCISIMNKSEIAAALRKEVGELEVSITQLQARCERLKRFVLELESEIAGPEVQRPVADSKFRKMIDQVFGEKPKRPRR